MTQVALLFFLGENTSFAKALVKSADGFVQKSRIELNFYGRQTIGTMISSNWMGAIPAFFFHDFATSPTLVPEVKSLPIHMYCDKPEKKNRLSNLLQVYRPSPCAASALISSASLAGAEGNQDLHIAKR